MVAFLQIKTTRFETIILKTSGKSSAYVGISPCGHNLNFTFRQMRKIHQDNNSEKHFANLQYKYKQQKQQTEKLNVIFGGFLHQDHYQTRNYRGAQRPFKGTV